MTDQMGLVAGGDVCAFAGLSALTGDDTLNETEQKREIKDWASLRRV